MGLSSNLFFLYDSTLYTPATFPCNPHRALLHSSQQDPSIRPQASVWKTAKKRGGLEFHSRVRRGTGHSPKPELVAAQCGEGGRPSLWGVREAAQAEGPWGLPGRTEKCPGREVFIKGVVSSHVTFPPHKVLARICVCWCQKHFS